MKKYLLSTAVFLFTVSACTQSSEVTPTDNFSKEIVLLKTMHKEGLYLASSAFEKNINLNSTNELVLNEKGIVDDVLAGLRGSYFTASDNFVTSLSSNFGTKNLSITGNANARQNISNANLSQLYNENQLKLANPFLDQLLTTDDFAEVKRLAVDFQNKVIASDLVREDKIQLLSLSTSVEALADFLVEGGDESIRQVLSQLKSTQGSPNSRVVGCSVNWRNVALAGVTGATYMGIKGAIAGCTGGTVTLPGIGTVTGCVGGAVFGGALGFTEGVSLGIIAELLGSCFR